MGKKSKAHTWGKGDSGWLGIRGIFSSASAHNVVRHRYRLRDLRLKKEKWDTSSIQIALITVSAKNFCGSIGKVVPP